jgi:catechol 2,3-dioxygenase-like lactoylglutathione lyase family enzyme
VLHHLAFSVEATGFEELTERLRGAGLELRGGVHPVLENVQTIYIDDPEGNEVELITPTRPTRAPTP